LPEGIELSESRKTFELLLSSGANIDEMNVVRKHLSQVKGGRLLKRIYPSECLTLIISDVVGDNLETIASGPTYFDSSTFSDAMRILDKYDLTGKLPKSVLEFFRNGVEDKVEETIKPWEDTLQKVNNIILGNNFTALESARTVAESMDYNTILLSSMMEGESGEAAKVVSGIVKQIKSNDIPVKKPACLLLGGETTVTIRGSGKGGRNQEFVLASLIQLSKEMENIFLLSCGTDGTDGPTDAAGAFVDKAVIEKVKELELNPAEFLKDNNSYEFFDKTGGLIKTGPTGTNVMDVVIILIS
jgi:glycerate-2-kinase